MDTTTIIFILIAILFVGVWFAFGGINEVVEVQKREEKKLRSILQSIHDQRKHDMKHLTNGIKETRQVFGTLLGIKDIEVLNDQSHIILTDEDGTLLFMDLCKINKQFVELLKVGKTIPSDNVRIFYRDVEYHYKPVTDPVDTTF